MTSADQIKTTIQKTKISVREASILFGVSRVAVHAWMKGGAIDPLRVNRVDRVVKALNFALEDEALPLGGPHLRRASALEARLQQIQKIVLLRLRREDIPSSS